MKINIDSPLKKLLFALIGNLLLFLLKNAAMSTQPSACNGFHCPVATGFSPSDFNRDAITFVFIIVMIPFNTYCLSLFLPLKHNKRAFDKILSVFSIFIILLILFYFGLMPAVDNVNDLVYSFRYGIRN